MDRKQYTDRLGEIHEMASGLLGKIHVLMDDIGGDAGTADWQHLYSMSKLASAAAEMAYGVMYPRPSALAESEV